MSSLRPSHSKRALAVSNLQEKSPGPEWKVQKRVHQLSRRFDFTEYDEMRDFLDQLEVLSESEGYYPDLTFSRTHVNVSIKARADELAQPDFDFSAKVDGLADGSKQEQQ